MYDLINIVMKDVKGFRPNEFLVTDKGIYFDEQFDMHKRDEYYSQYALLEKYFTLSQIDVIKFD